MSDDKVYTRSFVTGSHAYGTPRYDSDIDLVILVSESDLELLQKCSEKKNFWHQDEQYSRNTPQAACLRFGDLNIIACTDEMQYDVWKKGTKRLKAKAPVLREEAVDLFASLRAKAFGNSDDKARELQKEDKEKAKPRIREEHDFNIPF